MSSSTSSSPNDGGRVGSGVRTSVDAVTGAAGIGAGGAVGVGAGGIGAAPGPTEARRASYSIASRIAAALALIRCMRNATSSSVGEGGAAAGSCRATTVVLDGAGTATGAAAAVGASARATGRATTVVLDGAGASSPSAITPSSSAVGDVDSDNHAGGAHARGGSVVSAITGSCSDPSTVVVDGCGVGRGGGGATGRNAPELTTIVGERGGAAGGGAMVGAGAGAGAATGSRAAAVVGASVAFGFALRSSHSPQYRHLAAAS